MQSETPPAREGFCAVSSISARPCGHPTSKDTGRRECHNCHYKGNVCKAHPLNSAAVHPDVHTSICPPDFSGDPSNPVVHTADTAAMYRKATLNKTGTDCTLSWKGCNCHRVFYSCCHLLTKETGNLCNKFRVHRFSLTGTDGISKETG